MTLQDVFDQLSYGELSQLYMGEGGDLIDGIPKDKRKQIIGHIKLGLTDLHTRFMLREGSITIGLVTDKSSYFIDKRYAVSNIKSAEVLKYILDTDSPYQSDLLKIERIYAEDGTELPLNVIDDLDSVRTMSYNSFVLPATLTGATINVVYRASHPEIDVNLANSAPTSVIIELSPAYLQALLMFVASRAHTPIGMSSEFHDGNNYAAKYEALCTLLLSYNMSIDTDYKNTRLINNGWV